MIRTYASPLAFKEALEARLRERAQRDGRSINRVRQLVVMERFLARVFAGFDSAVLKGGMVMELRLERARATKDVDLRLNGSANEIVRSMYRRFRRIFSNSGESSNHQGPSPS